MRCKNEFMLAAVNENMKNSPETDQKKDLERVNFLNKFKFKILSSSQSN